MSSARRRAVLAIAVGAIALDSALLGLIAPLLPDLEERVGASESELGLALGAYALPVIVVSLPLGRLCDRRGRRSLLISGLLLTVIGSLAIAFAESLLPLIMGRGVQGIGAAASWIAALALVSDLAPPGRKGESIGYALAANGVGAIGGPALGGLTGEAIGFEFPFLLVAGIGVALAAAAIAVLPRDLVPKAAAAARGGLRDLFALALAPAVRPATIAIIVGATTIGVLEVVAPLDASERLGLGAGAIGALFAASIALDAIAAPIAGRASDRKGRRFVTLLGLVGVLLSAVLLAVLGGVGGLIVGLCVFGIGSSALFAAAVPWLDDAFAGTAKGFGYGFLNLIFAIGYAIGPIAAGVGFDHAGAASVYWIEAAALVATIALVFTARQLPASGPDGDPA